MTDTVGDGDFQKWGDPSNGGMILKWGVDTTLRTMKTFVKKNSVKELGKTSFEINQVKFYIHT